ncbi:hypothetical protein BJX63DRAFT_436478 [Aspergillus granulosus]|uniref:Mitochondrial division protein 1 n=1 Tax=Aspergillus granulosus TaxID=176169 RepID=A0ABR4GXT9_9EURO
MLDQAQPLPQGFSDPNAYEFGELNGHHIVIAYLPNGVYGTTSAAAVVSRMCLLFPQLRYGLMVGIGGGVPDKNNDIRLGDIVVSKPGGRHGGVIQYDLGKTVQDGQFVQTGILNQPPHALLSRLSQVEAKQIATGNNALLEIISGALERNPKLKEIFSPPKEHTDFLFNPSYIHTDKESDCTLCDKEQLVKRPPRAINAPRVHYGLIASGNQVMKDSGTRDRLAREHGILCFEMEAAGLMNELPTLVIRGICDYCDSHKQKQWQGYAALTAAAYAKLLLSVVPAKVATAAQLRPGFTGEDQRCLQELLLSHPKDDLRRIEATKGGLLGDSFRWVLDTAELRKWHSNPQSQLLWIKGDPGKGKTMLIIGIINELTQQVQSEPLQSLAYFLCQATDRRLNNAPSVLRGLIYMLIQQQPHLISHLRERYDTNPKLFESENMFYSLATIFENMIQGSTRALIYLLVDALDECETGLSDLLKLIARTKFMSAVQVKWIVSSRNRDDIEQELEFGNEKTKLSLELNSNRISDAVGAYINYRVSRLKALQRDEILVKRIKEQLLQKSNGTFLWVALVVQEMQKCKHLSAMVEVLEKTPRGLTPLYDRMLQQIQLLEGLDRDLCILVLSIALFAYRPLHLREFCRLAGLHERQHGSGDLESVVGMCGSFLTIRDDYVHLIHQSSKDYLSDVKISATVFPSGPPTVHHKIFRESLQNLSSKLRRNIYNLADPGISASETAAFPPDPDPLFDLRYSCTYWMDHFLETVPTSPKETSMNDYMTISDFFREHLLHWLESLSLIGEIRHGILVLRKLVHQQQKQNASQPSSGASSDRRNIWTILGQRRASRLPVSNQSVGHKQHTSILREFERFATSYGPIIGEAPLQVYGAALAFCPQASESKKLFWGERLDFIERASVMQETWDPCMRIMEGHTRAALAVAFSLDGQTIASAAADNTVRLWDPATGVQRRTLQGHTRSVFAVAFSPDGQIIASASHDSTIRLWNLVTGVEYCTLHGHTDRVHAVVFSPDGQLVASASYDNTIRLWDPATGVERRILQGHTGSVFATVASASDDDTIRFWDPATGVERRILQGHESSVFAVVFSPDGQTIASASDDNTIRLWDPATGVELRTLQGHMSAVFAVVFSPDGQTIASASDDNTIRLWDSATGVQRRTLQGHTRSVFAVAFSPDGQIVASASLDRKVRLWNPATGTERRTLQAHKGSVNAMAFSPDRKIVASASSDYTVRLWDSATGATHYTLQGHTDWVNAVAFSPDGKFIASASSDYTVRLWDTTTGVKCRTLWHSHWVNAVTFSSDGQTVATASRNGTVWLWDPVTGSEKDKHYCDVAVTAMSFSASGCWDTDRVSLSRVPQPFDSISRQSNDIIVHEKWITRNGQRLIWLPPEYRATCVVTHDNSVVLGHQSGLLTFFWLK